MNHDDTPSRRTPETRPEELTGNGVVPMVTDLGRPGGRALTEAGVRHVRLAYHYLDDGDLDGYTSLLADAWDDGVIGGRIGGRHEVAQVLAQGRRVAVTGRWTAPFPAGRAVDFDDVFDLSAESLLLRVRRSADTVHPPRRTPR